MLSDEVKLVLFLILFEIGLFICTIICFFKYYRKVYLRGTILIIIGSVKWAINSKDEELAAENRIKRLKNEPGYKLIYL